MAFPNNCNPRIIQVDDSCGCTLTRANITAFTPQAFEDQAFKEVGMDRIIAQTKEARMTGVKEKTLTDLFLSKMAPIKRVSLGQDGSGRSVIAPFIMVPQRHNINANYFVVETGAANPNAGVGATPASAWDLTIKNAGATYSSALANIEKYFLPGRYITILNKDTTTGVGRTLQYKILSSANANAGGVEKAKVTVEPNYSAAGWTALSAGDKTIYQTTHGLVVPLANSVSDYESWCSQDPSTNTVKLMVYWLQTIRETHCYNDEYIKALNAPLTSEYFKKFRTLPLAQQRKIQAMQAEKVSHNTLFFGQRINEKQSVEQYTQLPQVVDPANANCVIEYKANTIGWRQQLADCGRVTDLQGAQMDLDVLKASLYDLKRHREVDSGSIDRIDCMTDRFTADNIQTVMIDYYKQKYGVNTERFYQPNQRLVFNNAPVLEYALYDFPDEGVQLAVITDDFFNDHLTSFPTADKSRGRYLWLLDWSDVMLGLAGTNSAARQTNIADNLYNCVITPNVNHYQLNSKTIAAMIQVPNRHAIFENFSDACPKLTAKKCVSYS